jgi:hypothetical protein
MKLQLFYSSCALLGFSMLCGCASTDIVLPPKTATPTVVPSKFAPRWADFDEWRNLNLNMSLSEVVDVLGEPFMTSEGYIQDANRIEVMVFKLKPKYADVPKSNNRDVKPSKEIPKTVMWGQYYDLTCYFENKKLVRWITTPEGKQALKDTTQVERFPK